MSVSLAALWGIDNKVEGWLRSRGITAQQFNDSPQRGRQIILVGGVAAAAENPNRWQELARQIARGSVAIFLSPLAFQRGKDPVGWLPLEKKGRSYKFNDWLYHKESVAKLHPVFEGLAPQGVMDLDYYGDVVPQYLFDGQETPDVVAAAAFAVGYSVQGGYASGLLIASYPLGEGRFVLNTCRILENLDIHPTADRLILNMINHAAKVTDQPMSEVPANFEEQLKRLGYA